MATEKLPPCPFCGVSDAFVERADYSSAYVQCNNCGAAGPTETQEDDDEEVPGAGAAINSWRRRSNPSPGAPKSPPSHAEEISDVSATPPGYRLQPDETASKLVEALVRCRLQASYSLGDTIVLAGQLRKVREIVNEALAAYRQGGVE